MSGSAFRGVRSSGKIDIGNARALEAPRVVLKHFIILATDIKTIIDTINTIIKYPAKKQEKREKFISKCCG